MAEDESAYIDYETFLAPDFRPASFANALVVTTNNPNDLPLDLTTPLSRVLFDIQEIDSHIDLLTTRSAIPLLEHTRTQNNASQRIVTELDAQLQSLNDSYKQLEKEVINKHAEADEVRLVVTRLWDALRLARSTARCLQLGRQLELQHAEYTVPPASASVPRKEDPRSLVRCANTLLSLHEILDRSEPGQEGHGLNKVDAIRALQDSVVTRIERSLKETSEALVREFSIPATATFAQGEEAKARLLAALNALALISPVNWAQPPLPDKIVPEFALRALELHVRAAMQTSSATLARALGQLPNLDRAVGEVAARCQSLHALESVLAGAKIPMHPLAIAAAAAGHKTVSTTAYLPALLVRLETGSLASFFWRALANSISTRTVEIVNRGGISAKTLRNKKDIVGEAMRECVRKGSLMPNAVVGKTAGPAAPDAGKKWERETALMVGAVVNSIG
ncbi:hypothetical protein TD95_002302 [Thielaviopsis punctulata]|uniref:Conserved oligomeric Golgi complex subunit 5 n=1 Tax=Thielaviopsis punctulata TaxID=72032 RepID=A0A0F4Z9W5_9PEZI|nr:hypothetical protein TD95_002302 [Thielaviopsis punctulata]